MNVDPTGRELIRAALSEDLGPGDVTTDSVIPESARCEAVLIANASGVIAGLDVAAVVFAERDPLTRFQPVVADGCSVEPGDVVARVAGRTRSIISAERVALNFLQHLSGVASATAEFAEALGDSPTRLLDTRKTTPGMRSLEKQAVVLGGGTNHRMGLWDMALIKDNHIAAAGSIAGAVEAVRRAHPGVRIEVEVTSAAELGEALDAGADRVMLDNMTRGEMRSAIAEARRHPSRPEVEISGGVTRKTLVELGSLGADFISVGAITHSASALDISLEIL